MSSGGFCDWCFGTFFGQFCEVSNKVWYMIYNNLLPICQAQHKWHGPVKHSIALVTIWGRWSVAPVWKGCKYRRFIESQLDDLQSVGEGQSRPGRHRPRKKKCTQHSDTQIINKTNPSSGLVSINIWKTFASPPVSFNLRNELFPRSMAV